MATSADSGDYEHHIDRFLEKQKSKSEGTHSVRKTDVKDFSAWLEEHGHNLEEIKSWMLDDYFTDLKNKGYAPATIRSRWSTVKLLFDFLALREIYDRSPMEARELKLRNYTQIKNREEAEAKEIKFVTEAEKEKLVENVAAPKLREKLLIRLLWQTGIRANEVETIRLDDIDREERSIEVWDSKTQDKRSVYYQESLDFLLKQWLDHGHRSSFPASVDSDRLFVTNVGGRMAADTVNQKVKEAAGRAGIQEELYTDMNGNTRYRITSHSLRHGHGRYSLLCGIDIQTISQHMGHDSLEMTRRYLDLIDHDVRDAYRNNWGSA